MYRAAVVIGVLLLIACSSDSESPTVAAPSSQSAAASTTTTSTTTTIATTTTVIPPAPASSPEEAASTFMSAWRAGDRDTALTVAVPAAVDAVFAAGEPGSVQNRGCNSPPVGPVLCVYRTDPGEVQVRVQPTADGNGWYVDQARVTEA